jgi:hypothetical protein
MARMADTAQLDDSGGREQWFGVETPVVGDGPDRETPLGGGYSMSGNISDLEVLFAGVVTDQFPEGDAGYHVKVRVPQNNGAFTLTCWVDYDETV